MKIIIVPRRSNHRLLCRELLDDDVEAFGEEPCGKDAVQITVLPIIILCIFKAFT